MFFNKSQIVTASFISPIRISGATMKSNCRCKEDSDERSARKRGRPRQNFSNTPTDISFKSTVWDSANACKTNGGYIVRYYYHRGLRKVVSKPEHVLVWERVHNRAVPRSWCVHHRDGNKMNNRAENLILMPVLYHQELHVALKKAENKFTGIVLEVERQRLVETYVGKAEYYAEIWALVDFFLLETGLS